MIGSGTFSCGHTAAVPRNMGRGKARERRVAAFFARPCCECRVELEMAHIARLTRGKPTQEAIDVRLNKIRNTYR